jgi:hypothetical protein
MRVTSNAAAIQFVPIILPVLCSHDSTGGIEWLRSFLNAIL